jgi:hypothetical protein
MPLKRYVLLSIAAFLGVVGISIVWRFLTAKYPTHSDVFFMGVEAGALAVLLLVCVSLIGYFLYRLTALSSRRKAN